MDSFENINLNESMNLKIIQNLENKPKLNELLNNIKLYSSQIQFNENNNENNSINQENLSILSDNYLYNHILEEKNFSFVNYIKKYPLFDGDKIFDENYLKLLCILKENFIVTRNDIKFIFQKISEFIFKKSENFPKTKEISKIFELIKILYGQLFINKQDKIQNNYFELLNGNLSLNLNNFIYDHQNLKNPIRLVLNFSFKNLNTSKECEIIKINYNSKTQLEIINKNNGEVFVKNFDIEEKIFEYKTNEIIKFFIIIIDNILLYEIKNETNNETIKNYIDNINLNYLNIQNVIFFNNLLGEIYYIIGYFTENNEQLFNYVKNFDSSKFYEDYFFDYSENKFKENLLKCFFIFTPKICSIEKYDENLNKIKSKIFTDNYFLTNKENKIHIYFDNTSNIESIGDYFIFLPFFEIILNLFNIEKNNESLTILDNLFDLILYLKNKNTLNENYELFYKLVCFELLKFDLDEIKEIKNLKLFINDNKFLNNEYEINTLFHLIYNNNLKLNNSEIIDILYETKNIEKNIRKIFKNLFFNNGFWQFLNENEIKYKIYNFITNDYKKIILSPILNLNEYIENNNILQIEKIFKKDFLNKNYNFFNFNLNYNKLLNIESLNINNFKNKFPKLINCCLIKQTHHIKGFLLIKTNYFYFYSYPKHISEKMDICLKLITENEEENNKTKFENCFGSFLVCPEKDYNINFKIFKENIKFLLPRKYFFRNTGLEFYLFNGKNYYFNFHTKSERERILNNIFKYNYFKFIVKENVQNNSLISTFLFENISVNNNSLNEQIVDISNEEIFLGYINENIYKLKNNQKKKINLNEFFNLWNNNQISNYELLMLLNILANRSFLDLTQYPIFPWIIFSKDIYRNLKLPMGQNNFENISNNRMEIFNHNYKDSISNLKNIDQFIEPAHISKSFYYVVNYSNVNIINNYLIRIFPFNLLCHKINQDSFENNEFLFNDILNTLKFSLSSQTDVKEIIPEFFYFPEFLININNFILNYQNENKFDNVNIQEKLINNLFYNKIKKKLLIENSDFLNNINDDNDIKSVLYVLNLKRIFESEIITEKINYWIDLVFGINQKLDFDSKNIETNKIKNLFRPESYLDNPENTNKHFLIQPEKEINLLNSCENGLIPAQILTEKMNKKYYKNNNNNSNYYFSNFFKKNEKYEKIEELLLSKSGYFFIKYKKINKILNLQQNNIIEINKNFYKKYFLVSITSWNIIKIIRKKYLLFGNKKGDVLVFELKKNYEKYYNNYDFDKLIFTISLRNHTKEITSIFYNKDLNLIVTSSKDSTINIYNNDFHLISSFKIDENFYSVKTFIINNPIPSIICYTNKKSLISYNLNNKKMIRKIDNVQNISNLFIIKDSFFEENLVYIEDKNILNILSLPEFTKFKSQKNYKINFDVVEIYKYPKEKFKYIILGNERQYSILELEI